MSYQRLSEHNDAQVLYSDSFRDLDGGEVSRAPVSDGFAFGRHRGLDVGVPASPERACTPSSTDISASGSGSHSDACDDDTSSGREHEHEHETDWDSRRAAVRSNAWKSSGMSSAFAYLSAAPVPVVGYSALPSQCDEDVGVDGDGDGDVDGESSRSASSSTSATSVAVKAPPQSLPNDTVISPEGEESDEVVECLAVFVGLC